VVVVVVVVVEVVEVVDVVDGGAAVVGVAVVGGAVVGDGGGGAIVVVVAAGGGAPTVVVVAAAIVVVVDAARVVVVVEGALVVVGEAVVVVARVLVVVVGRTVVGVLVTGVAVTGGRVMVTRSPTTGSGTVGRLKFGVPSPGAVVGTGAAVEVVRRGGVVAGGRTGETGAIVVVVVGTAADDATRPESRNARFPGMVVGAIVVVAANTMVVTVAFADATTELSGLATRVPAPPPEKITPLSGAELAMSCMPRTNGAAIEAPADALTPPDTVCITVATGPLPDAKWLMTLEKKPADMRVFLAPTERKARITAGSKCVPEHLTSSARASS
jgi:hypothetical protein